MPRELVYRVTIDTSSAKREAAHIRTALENELRSIKVGDITVPRMSGAAKTYDDLATGADKVAKANKGVSETLENLITGYLSLQGAQMAWRGLSELDKLGTQATRSAFAFDKLSGGADKAGANLLAIQRAGAGTIGMLAAAETGTQALSLKLADTGKEFADLTTAARAVTIVSPVINDAASAVSELGIAASNLSWRRLDQLGLSVGEVREEFGQLRRENEGLDESAAFLEATVGLLNEKYGDLVTSTEAAATGQERLTVAFGEFARLAATADFTKSLVSGPFESLAGLLEATNVSLFGERAGAFAIENQLAANAEMATRAYMTTADALGEAYDIVKRINDAAVAGVPGVAQYQQQALEAGAAIVRWGYVTDEQIAKLQQLNSAVAGLGTPSDPNAFGNIATMAAQAERAAAEQRAAGIFEQQSGINQSLNSAAQKSVGTLGLEQTIATLKEQKALVDQAITELVASATVDPDEISLRIAEIQQMAVQAFSDMAAMMPEVDPSVTAGSFETINQAMQALNQGFVDFLPSASAVRDELASLAEEVMFTGVVTDEQAAALQNYASVAAAISDETSLLSAVTDELGISFLYANPEASGLIDAMYQAQASYLSGSITAEAYAGMISVLGQQLLILAQQAGVATGSILALVQAQAGLAGKGGFQVGAARGNAVAARISAQQDARDRQRAIQEAERAAKRSAQEQERSAKRAGKELESAAKKAGQELKSALDKVPGLFRRTQVTEQDVKFSEAGVYQDKADEYLRRLQAEVEQGKDIFPDVDIESAKQSLRDLGVQVADDSKVAFEQFADAYESGLLFADPANIEKYINKDAVEREMELQKKAEEGRNNVYKAFGVVIEDAAAAAAGGASGGGGGGISVGDIDFTPQVAAAIDDSPLFNGEPYLLNLDPVVDQNAIWSQLEMPAGGGSKGWNIPVQPVMYGPQPKPGAGFPAFNPTAMGLADLSQQAGGKVEVTATLAPDAGSTLASDLADQLAKQVDTFKSQGGTIGDILLAGISESFNVIQGDQVVDTGVADGIIASIGAQLGAKMEVLKNVGKGAGEIVKSGLAENISSTQWVDGEMVAPIATGMVTAINTQIRSQSEAFKREGTTAGQLVMAGVSGGFGGTAGMNGEPSTDLAMAMVKALNTQFTTAQNFFYATGQPAAFSVMDGYKGSFVASGEGTPLVTPMITAINTQIRASSESLRAQGTTMAQYVQHGFTTAFNGESFKAAIVAAGETMGAYLEIGILSRISGGALVEAIGAQILADMSAEVEAP